MRLDFNVLWVDDQPDRVAAQVRRIAHHMEEHGFEFKPTSCQTIEQVRGHLASHIFNDEIDLILVDWDLGGGVQGQEAIAAIRESILYKDVVFYSAQTPPDTLRSLASEAGLEGVYCANRDGLVDEVVGVFESLVKKVLDLDHSRGIVMGATSDIDHMVNECLSIIYMKHDGDGQAALLNDAFYLIESRVTEISARVSKLRDAANLGALLDAHIIFTANDRLRILSRALKVERFKALGDARPSVIKYLEDVVPERNILGHQVLAPEGRPNAIADSKGNQVSLEQVRELRRSILSVRVDFRSLLDRLRGAE